MSRMENTPDISLSSRPWLCLLSYFLTRLSELGSNYTASRSSARQILMQSLLKSSPHVHVCFAFEVCAVASVCRWCFFGGKHLCTRAHVRRHHAEACDTVSVVEAHLRYLSSAWDFSLFVSFFFAHLFSSNLVYQNGANFYT